MVTDLQFYKAVKSYNYRRSLIQDIPDIELKIISFLNEKETHEIRIPGYFISRSNGFLNIKEAPIIPINQLELNLDRETI